MKLFLFLHHPKIFQVDIFDSDTMKFMLLFLLLLSLSEMKRPPRLSSGGFQAHHVSRAGDNIRLQCPLESSFQPPPLISWHKDDETIHVGWSRIKMADHDRILRIKDLEVSDSGVYICKATNGFGSVEAKYLLYVHDNNTTPPPGSMFSENIFENIPGKEIRPKFLRPSDMEARVIAQPGESIKLPCHNTGRPKPDIVWYREGRQMFREDLQAMAGEALDDSGGGVLKISNARERHAGRYTCKIFNSAGSINFTFDLQVAVVNKDDEPHFVEGYLENATAFYGHPASFKCVVRSSSVPLVQWLKPVPASSETKFLSSASINNTVILNNQRYLILQGAVTSNEDVFSSTLAISSVSQYDYGMYICSVASNKGLLHRSVFLLPHSDDSAIKSETQLISPGHYFVFGIVVSLGIALLIIFATVIVCCKRGASKHKDDNRSASRRDSAARQDTCGSSAAPRPGPSTLFQDASGTWQVSTYSPRQVPDDPAPPQDAASNIQLYYQPSGTHNFSIQEENHQAPPLKAHHYSLISGSSVSHQTPPSMVSVSSSQKQFFYRPPFHQQQAPLLGSKMAAKD